MSEDQKIVLGFVVGVAAYAALEILAGLSARRSADRRKASRRDPARTRRSAILAFYFGGGVGCLFVGKYLLGILFVVLALVIRFLSGTREGG